MAAYGDLKIGMPKVKIERQTPTLNNHISTYDRGLKI
jgi:hypothetical protein